jgi:hypothetical protein
MNTGDMIGWCVIAVFGLWWLGWLFTRGASAARKDRAIRTGDASGLTIEDKAENRQAFIQELAKPGPATPGSSIHGTKACATLGAVLIGIGMVVGIFEAGTSTFSSMPICGGLLLLFLSGALALGGGK